MFCIDNWETFDRVLFVYFDDLLPWNTKMSFCSFCFSVANLIISFLVIFLLVIKGFFDML